MNSRSSSDTQTATDSPTVPTDVYKTNRPNASHTFSRAPRAATNLVGGVFEATAAGFRELGAHLDDDSLLRVGVDNGFVEGAVAASGRFFTELAKVSERVYADLQQSGRAPTPAPIDYVRLARLVAAEIRSGSLVVPEGAAPPAVVLLETPGKVSP